MDIIFDGPTATTSGQKTSPAELESMNRRVSLGQAIRSVFGRSLVTHFIAPPPPLAS